MLNQKHAAYQSRNNTEIRDARRDVRAEIKKAKQYKNKLEEKFGSNNFRAVWYGMRKMAGMGQTENESITIKGYVIYCVYYPV